MEARGVGVGGIPPGGVGPAGSTVDQRGELILIKRQLMQIAGPDQNRYWALVSAFLQKRLSKADLDAEVPKLIGAANVPMHELFLRKMYALVTHQAEQRHLAGQSHPTTHPHPHHPHHPRHPQHPQHAQHAHAQSQAQAQAQARARAQAQVRAQGEAQARAQAQARALQHNMLMQQREMQKQYRQHAMAMSAHQGLYSMADVSAHPHPPAPHHQQQPLRAEDAARYQLQRTLAAAAAAEKATKVPIPKGSKGKKSAGENSGPTKRRKTASTPAVAAAPPLPGSVPGSRRPLGAPPTAIPPHATGAHAHAHAHASMSYPSIPVAADGVPSSASTGTGLVFGADGRSGSGAGFASAAASFETDALRGARAVFVSPGVVTLGDAAPTRPGQYDVAPLPIVVAAEDVAVATVATPSALPPTCVAPPRGRPFVEISSSRASAARTARGRQMGVPERNASEWKIATDFDAIEAQMRLSAHDAALRTVAPECVPVMARAAAAFIERTFKRCVRARDDAAARGWAENEETSARRPPSGVSKRDGDVAREGGDSGSDVSLETLERRILGADATDASNRRRMGWGGAGGVPGRVGAADAAAALREGGVDPASRAHRERLLLLAAEDELARRGVAER